MSTHISSGADEVLASAAEEAGPVDPLDTLLKQIVEGYFVLTDGQGSVSKWSEPAELLFGRPAQEILGQSFFGTLVDQPLSPAAENWRAFLEQGSAPTEPGRVSVEARHAESFNFPVEAVFVPVKLDEGFDFSLFLEDLGFELPLNLMLLRMRQQHPVVVRALRQAIEDEPQPWEGWRTAGTLVVFRPTAPTPWVAEELAAREARRAEEDAEKEDRMTPADPGVHGSSVRDLDDAAAVVARLLSALERIDDLERMATGLPAQVQEARRDAEQSRSRAEAAERESARLREDLQRALNEIKQGGNDQQHLELLARMERLERARLDEDEARMSALKAAEAARAELAQRLERAEADRARAAEAIEVRVADAVEEARRKAEEALEEARNRADGARSSFESRIVELEKLRSGDAEAHAADIVTQLEQVRAEHEEAVQNARHELAETLEGIERDRERDAEAARAELQAALERIEHVQRESDALREQLTQVTVERAEADGLAGEERRRLAELQRGAEESRARIDALREETTEARNDAAALRGEIEALRSAAPDLDAVRAEHAEALEALRGQVAELQSGSGSDLEELRRTAEELRAEQARSQEEFAARHEEIERDRAAAAELREQLDALKAEDVGEVRALAESLRERSEVLEEEIAERRRAEQDFAQRHEDVVQAQAEITRRHDELAGAGDELRAEQVQLHEAVAAARRERDEFHAKTEHALAQLAEVRQALREHESSISVQLPSNAVEHEEFDAFAVQLRGEFAALREAEAALVARIEGLDAGAARLDEVFSRVDAVAARIEEVSATAEAARVEGLDERFDALGARLDDAAARDADLDGRVQAAAADAAAAQAAAQEMVEAGREIAARLDEADREEDALSARVEAAVAEAAGVREELSSLHGEAREALAAARDAAERIDEIDRSSANVLADVRAVRDRVDEVATLARAAQEASDGSRTDADELRAAVARLTGELQVARGELERAGEESLGAREAASTAQQAAAAAREDAGRAREETAAIKREAEAGRERVAQLGASVERFGDSLTQTAAAADAAQLEATAARRAGKELTQLVADLDAKTSSLRNEMGTGVVRLKELDASIDQLGTAAMRAGQDAESAKKTIIEEGVAIREELSEVRTIAEKAAAAIEAMRSDVDEVKNAAKKMAADSAASVESVVAGERRLEAMGAEVTFALKSLEEIKAGLTSAGQAAVIARREAEQAKKAAQTAGEGSKDNVTEVFAQLLGLAAKKSNSGIHRRPSNPGTKKGEPVKREPRHGFDDVSQPMAVLGLDGKFRELNPAFAKLVGYQEHEFAKATWPSPHDRSVYQQQQDQLAQLAVGEIESVIVQSTYMHGQGLMVPVIGKISTVLGEDGLPVNLLLEAEDRHHS